LGQSRVHRSDNGQHQTYHRFPQLLRYVLPIPAGGAEREANYAGTTDRLSGGHQTYHRFPQLLRYVLPIPAGGAEREANYAGTTDRLSGGVRHERRNAAIVVSAPGAALEQHATQATFSCSGLLERNPWNIHMLLHCDGRSERGATGESFTSEDFITERHYSDKCTFLSRSEG
uniref:Uncharacterized protein n=1 Tax=Anopheles coluzzii TaxID=1518534 RepID=A0A8W7P5F2_ANOCL